MQQAHKGFTKFLLIKNPVQICPDCIAHAAAIRLLLRSVPGRILPAAAHMNQRAAVRIGQVREAHMDFITAHLFIGEGLEPSRELPGSSLHAGSRFGSLKNSSNRKEPHAAHASVSFRTTGILNPGSQHLIAAADTKDNRTCSHEAHDRCLQTAFPKPPHIAHCALRPRQNDDIRTAELRYPVHIAHRQGGLQKKRLKIGKIGYFRKANHCKIDIFSLFSSSEAFCKGILLLDLHVEIRNDT